MRKATLGLVLVGATVALAGCGATNSALVERHQTVEYYRIFHIATDASRYEVSQAASRGLSRNVNAAQEARPIPTFTTPPEEPGRFQLVDPFAGSAMSAMASAGGSIGMRVATCDGAVWTASARRTIAGSNNLQLTACLWEYAGGYHLDTYANFQKLQGGIRQISRSMASAMVGTPEEWTEKTMLDIVRAVREATGAEVTLVEGYPPLSGTPWLDRGEEL